MRLYTSNGPVMRRPELQYDDDSKNRNTTVDILLGIIFVYTFISPPPEGELGLVTNRQGAI